MIEGMLSPKSSQSNESNNFMKRAAGAE